MARSGRSRQTFRNRGVIAVFDGFCLMGIAASIGGIFTFGSLIGVVLWSLVTVCIAFVGVRMLTGGIFVLADGVVVRSLFRDHRATWPEVQGFGLRRQHWASTESVNITVNLADGAELKSSSLTARSSESRFAQETVAKLEAWRQRSVTSEPRGHDPTDT